MKCNERFRSKSRIGVAMLLPPRKAKVKGGKKVFIVPLFVNLISTINKSAFLWLISLLLAQLLQKCGVYRLLRGVI